MMRVARPVAALLISLAIGVALIRWSRLQDRWVLTQFASPGGGTAVELAVDADGPIRGFVLTSTPRLSVRCAAGGALSYSVTTRLPAAAEPGPERTVRYRFDESEPVLAAWMESTNRHTLSAPADAVPALIDRLSGATRFVLTYIPFNAEPASATFSVNGFQRHWTEALALCGL
ncbi:MAG: hypothetical protein ABL961_08995 [Vicinamibacterales bacterium]